MVTNFLIDRGISRDSVVWTWGKVLAIATLITSGTLDLTYWANYIGLHPTVTEVHLVQVLAFIIGYCSAQYSTSPLFSKAAAAPMSTPVNRPPAAAWLLPLLLIPLLTLGACASLPAKQRAVDVVRTVETTLGAAQDLERANHGALGLDIPATASQASLCPRSTVLLPAAPTKHQVVSCLFAVAFTSQIATSTALQTWKAGEPAPVALGELRGEVDALLGIVHGLSANANQQQLVATIQAIADGVLQAVTMTGGGQ